jgi:hypothetical protein
MMILRTAILGAMVLCGASLAMAEEVLYCTDTDATGFRWDHAGKATSVRFNPARYTVKVISGTERSIAEMTGDGAGEALTYTCNSAHDQIVCDAGGSLWMFYKNNYTHAFLVGTPVGPPKSMDPNIWIAYGTCTGF